MAADNVNGMWKEIGKRLVATFVAAAIPNILVGSLVDVSIGQSALQAGGIAVLGVVQLLAAGMKDDGKLSADEIEEAFH